MKSASNGNKWRVPASFPVSEPSATISLRDRRGFWTISTIPRPFGKVQEVAVLCVRGQQSEQLWAPRGWLSSFTVSVGAVFLVHI